MRPGRRALLGAATAALALRAAWSQSPDRVYQLGWLTAGERSRAGNLTRVMFFSLDAAVSRYELLREIFPTRRGVRFMPRKDAARRPDDRVRRRIACFVERVLEGTKTPDLPFEQPTTFELAVNLGAAGALGLIIPQSILAKADRAIE